MEDPKRIVIDWLKERFYAPQPVDEIIKDLPQEVIRAAKQLGIDQMRKILNDLKEEDE